MKIKNNSPPLKDLFNECVSIYKLSLEEIMPAVKDCLLEAWHSFYGDGYNLEIEWENDQLMIYRIMQGVDKISNRKTEFIGTSIKKEKVDLSIFPIVIINKAIQHLNESLLSRKKYNEYEKYKNCENQLFSCFIKSINRDGNIIVSVDGIYDGILINNHRDITSADLKKILQCRLQEIKDNKHRLNEPQLIFERSSNEFVQLLVAATVPEIKNGSIRIINIARDPGIRTKILLELNTDMEGSSSLNVIGACLGYNNTRKNIISSELNGEKVHFYAYKTGPDEKTTIKANIYNCFNRIRIIDILFNQHGEVAVIVANEDVSKCIGQNGSFISLIKRLLQINIIIISEDEFRSNINKQKEENKKDFLLLNFSDRDASILSDITISDLCALYKYLNRVEDKQKLQNYIDNLEEKQRAIYIEQGGDANFFNSLEGLSSSVYFMLLKYDITSFNQLQSYTPLELEQMTNIPSEVFDLILKNKK